MEKSREARRSATTTTTMAASNGVTKRRQRISENSRGQIHHEVVTVRDRPEKKERDPESLNRSKRRRSGRFSSRNERDFGEEDSSDEESHGDDDVRRKSFPSCRIPRHASATLKIADEMIGVPIPRKARSACMKRSHDCRTSSGSGGVGFGEDRRRTPASPGSYSFETASPSSSTVSVKHNKIVIGSKSRIPKPPKSSGTIEDDLEIEIAEVLSGLKKQPHNSSKREDNSENSLKSSEVKATKKLKTDCDDSSNPEKSSVPLVPETQDLSVSKGVSEGQNNKDESNCSNSKLEIDLMVPPSSPERVSLIPLVSDSIVTKDSSLKKEEKIVVKNEMTPEEVKHKNVEKQEWLNIDLEKPSQETVRDSSLRLQNFDWSYQPQQAKSGNQTLNMITNSVLPFPVAVSGWSNELPPHGYVPVDANNVSSTQVAPFSTSQPKPKRCATHLFIARNIQLHQHFLKTNKASLIYPKDELKPATTTGNNNPSSPILSLNTQAQDRIIAANESSHFALTRLKKPQPPPPPHVMPTQTFIFQTTNQPKSSRSASVNFSHHPNSSSPNEASSSPSPPPYFTMIPNNAYPYQRNGAPNQALSFYNGSFYSPHQMFLQPPQPQRETKASSCSSSSHRQQPQPQPQVTVKHRQQQSQKSETKVENSDSRSVAPYASIQPQNFSVTFASPSPPANLSFSSSNGGYHIVPESKTGAEDHPKKTMMMNGQGQTLVFDNPPRTLNFVSGTWPHAYHNHHHHKTTTHHHESIPATSSSSSQRKHHQHHPVTTTSASLTSCSSLKQGGETQISFATPSTQVTRSKVIITNKASPQPQDNQTENSTPKTSPVCGRTVPPIITSHQGHHHHHLSELKY